MPAVRLENGDYTRGDHTPGADVAAGDVVVQGDFPGIATVDIPANTLGQLAYQGGIWSGELFDTVTAGGIVHWRTADQLLSAVAGGGANKKIGYALTGGVAGDRIKFLLQAGTNA